MAILACSIAQVAGALEARAADAGSGTTAVTTSTPGPKVKAGSASATTAPAVDGKAGGKGKAGDTAKAEEKGKAEDKGKVEEKGKADDKGKARAEATADQPDPPQCSTPDRPDPTVLAEGGQKVAQLMFETPKDGSEAEQLRLRAGGAVDDFYVIAIGPDGVPMVAVPPNLPETTRIAVVFYHAPGPDYDLTVTGCQPVPIRVSGSLAAVATAAPKVRSPGAAPPELRPYVASLGKCSGDSTVTLTIKVPANVCTAPAITFKTDPVYNVTVALGGMVSVGNFNEVGVTQGVGGAPSTVFERKTHADFNVGAVVMVYPWGLNPNAGQGIGRLCFGTAVPFTWPINSVNLLVGYSVLPGLQLAVGVEILRRETVLDAGLHDGSTFNDDSSTLPKHEEWKGSGAAVFNASLSTDLLSKILGH